jgi:SagB-type dehydrogenase family enzyme
VRKARYSREGGKIYKKTYSTQPHKTYPRMLQYLLPAPRDNTTPLTSVLGKRVSCGDCIGSRACTLVELGDILGYALRIRPDGRRPYPSGGAQYPIECYLVGRVIEGEPSGVYHYDPTRHSLEFLWETSRDFSMERVIPNPSYPRPPFLCVFSVVWSRTTEKYGTLAYSHTLIEIGHIQQNLSLVSSLLDFQSRPIAGFEEHLLTRELDIDGRSEQVLHTISPRAHTASVF